MNTKTTIALGFVACAAAGVGIGLLTRNITQRQAEAMHPYARLVPLNETVTDPAEWGKNFPRQYDTYKRTVDMERTRYGGSEADPDHPGLTTDKLKADPRLKKMWNGYAFAVDFREE
ncbi:MAG: ammonia-forming cytochrome c nitrite reductase subunit c552, partial [Akkermansiaceae bacterium]|nr:ammonia-forming cytochrome c nitrite reductase subunit c552 [Akkermansiaceae bacterium]